MKNWMSLKGLMALALSILVISACSELEEINPEPASSLDQVGVTPTSGNTYYLRCRRSGKYLDVSGASNNNGANIHQWTFHGGTNQQWQVLNTSNGYVRLKGVDSGKSLEIAGGSNSNGANAQQWAYNGTTHQQWQILATSDGYFRLKSRDSGKSLEIRSNSTANGGNAAQWAYVGSISQQWFFEEVGSSGGGGGGSTGSAQDILGGLTNWKLNAYSGTLNVSSSNNGLSYVDNASKSDNSSWFYGSNGYAYFKTYPGNPKSSSGTSNPRTELREMTSNGSTEIHWDGTTGTEHSMKWKVRVDDLPPSGKLCFGQIHAESGSSFDDVIRIQVEGSSGQNSGGVTLRILGYATEDLLGSGQSVSGFTFNMDTEYYFELTMQNEIVKLYALNSNGSRNGSALFTSGSVDSDANYFKAGCYLQSTSSSDSGSSVYGLVGISELSVSH